MLAAWEREYPGRTESIFSALRNVEPAHLADPGDIRFQGPGRRKGCRVLRSRSLSRTGSFPGRLLAGKYPGGKNLQDLERRLGPLLDAGFDAFLDLTEAGEVPAYDGYLPANVASTCAGPSPIMACRAMPRHMAEILAALDGAARQGRRVYVHCRAGIGRTGTVVACHLIEQGLAPAAALTRLNELWQG